MLPWRYFKKYLVGIVLYEAICKCQANHTNAHVDVQPLQEQSKKHTTYQPLLMFDPVLFRDTGIATLRLYIIAAAVIAQQYGAVLQLPRIGHDNHLGVMPRLGKSTEDDAAMHPFDYYFDASYMSDCVDQSVSLTAVSNLSDHRCGARNAEWVDVMLQQDDILDRVFLSKKYPNKYCFKVLSFPSIGVYTTPALQIVREAVAGCLRLASRLSDVVRLVQAYILHSAAKSEQASAARPGMYNAVYSRADSDWYQMCIGYYFQNCYYSLEAYIFTAKSRLPPDVPLLVAGKASRTQSVLHEFGQHFQQVFSLSTIVSAIVSCCSDSGSVFCGDLISKVSANDLQLGNVCQVMTDLGDHDRALIEHELCVVAEKFVGNILSSFSFNVRDARARNFCCAAHATQCFGALRSCSPHHVIGNIHLAKLKPSGSYVVGTFPASCNSPVPCGLCARERDLYLHGCNNSQGFSFLGCWYRVLLGKHVNNTEDADSRRVEQAIAEDMFKKSGQE